MKELALKYLNVIIVAVLLSMIGGYCLYADWSDEQQRKANETAVLIGYGYTDVTMMDERGTCPRGIYARWYKATNPSGVKEHGLVCITYGDETPYVIPTYKREGNS